MRAVRDKTLSGSIIVNDFTIAVIALKTFFDIHVLAKILLSTRPATISDCLRHTKRRSKGIHWFGCITSWASASLSIVCHGRMRFLDLANEQVRAVCAGSRWVGSKRTGSIAFRLAIIVSFVLSSEGAGVMRLSFVVLLSKRSMKKGKGCCCVVSKAGMKESA